MARIDELKTLARDARAAGDMALFERAVNAVEYETQAIAQRESTEAQRIAQATGQDPALFAGDAQPTSDELGIDSGSVGGFVSDVGKNVAGLPETALAIGSQGVAPIAAGYGGMVTGLGRTLDGEAYKAGSDVEAIQSALTFQPKTDFGKEMLENTVGMIGSAADAVGLVDAIKWLEESGKEAGEAGEELGLPPSVNALLETAPQMLPEMLALVTQTRQVKPLLEAAAKADILAPAKAVSDIKLPQTKSKQEIARKLAEGEIDKTVAGYQLESPNLEAPVADIKPKQLQMSEQLTDLVDTVEPTVKPRVVKDPLQKKALSMGFEDRQVADFAAASPATKSKMLKMVNARKKALMSGREDILGRSSDVMGSTILERVNFLKGKKTKAGNDLDKAAENLRGKNVDVAEAFEGFRDDLQGLDVSVDAETGKLNFSGSMVDDVKASRIINNVFERAKRAFEPKIVNGIPQGNAHELHKLKRYIDNKVSYKAQGKEGLDAAGERVVKRLRAKIDEALDSASPEYDQANIAYADTKTAIDGIEDILGSKIDTTSKGADRALGIKVRGIQSNAAYGTRLLNALDELDATSAKYGRKFNDDIITMAQLNKAMDEVLGTQAKTSFAGEIGQEVGRAAPISGEAISAIGKVGKKFKGVTPENQLKALEGLLRN